MKFELTKKLLPGKAFAILACGAAFALATTGASAALVDNGLYTADTVSGLDWLDLTATQGQSVTTALSSHSGWSYATDTQLSGLLSSFGIAYGFRQGTYVDLSATTEQAMSFVSLLGATAGPSVSLGGYYNSAVEHSTYMCVAYAGCGPLSFTNDVDFSGGAGFAGQFLVRDSAAAAVPEPETYAMILAGLGLMGVVARRRKPALAA